jgi:transposase
MKTTKRNYTTEFKDEAVRLVVREGLSTLEAARRIEISDKTLANWVRLARHGKALSSGGAEIVRKARSVSELEMEKEILKKATAFFVRESQ